MCVPARLSEPEKKRIRSRFAARTVKCRCSRSPILQPHSGTVAAVPTDAELLAAWRNGDTDAATTLVDRYFDSLYRFFGSKIDVGIEDLIQETLLACVESRDKLEDTTKFRAFLFGIARRRLYRKWRGEQRGSGAIDFGLASVVDINTSPSGKAAQRQEEAAVLTALRQIPVDLQIALELFYWEELRACDIAEVLEIPEGTVRSRIRRARVLVRDLLASAGEPSDDASIEGRVRDLGTTGRD